MVVERFERLHIKGRQLVKAGTNGPPGSYRNLRTKSEYGIAVRFAISLLPHNDNLYNAVNMWHSVEGYIRLTSLSDRLIVTPDIIRVVGMSTYSPGIT